MELPQYTVYIEVPRVLFPKTLKLIFLAMGLYLAIWLNFFITKKTLPFMYSILIMIGIIVLIIISTIYNYAKFSKYQYCFYMDRIEYYGETQGMIVYSQIKNLQVQKNFFDILFNTGKITMTGFEIRYVPNLNQVYFYVQKMVEMYIPQQYPQQYAEQYARQQYAPQQYSQVQEQNNQNNYYQQNNPYSQQQNNRQQ